LKGIVCNGASRRSAEKFRSGADGQPHQPSDTTPDQENAAAKISAYDLSLQPLAMAQPIRP
jgi:hypothetical protein